MISQRILALIGGSIGRLEAGARNPALDLETREWCECIAGDLTLALALLEALNHKAELDCLCDAAPGQMHAGFCARAW